MWAAATQAQPVELPGRVPTRPASAGYRMHVLVSEEVDPDGLRGLARPGVTLWVKTRSNMLRASMVEALARFEVAYVQLRPPVLAAHAAQLERARGAGFWLEEAELEGPGVHLRGPRRLAVHIAGELSPGRAERIRRARPAAIFWEPSEPPDIEAFSVFVRLPGAKVVDLGEAAEALPGCGPWTQGLLRDVALRQGLWRTSARLPALLACPGRVQLRVEPSIGDAALARLFEANPAVELEVGLEEGLQAIRALLDRLDRRGSER